MRLGFEDRPHSPSRSPSHLAEQQWERLRWFFVSEGVPDMMGPWPTVEPAEQAKMIALVSRGEAS